ncbi:gem-associated protein 5 [Elysia marginata]|uniref:Gem-associated protein 5 n=1 Tax=Elysia marginata TaxID=1093978 RepID=A0AAV4IET0_9GAST|nr:gem-associated protein 5 [Elysia marginata]
MEQSVSTRLVFLPYVPAALPGQDPADIIDEKPHLGLYTDKLGAHRCLLQESARHLGDGKMDYHLHLEMWRGNVAGAVQLAMQRNELSDWIVAMAPMASRETWENVCVSYAAQLEEDGQYYKAASYLLAVNRVCPAIELFQRHHLYREAVSLAKVRLSPIDPLLENLYLEWGGQLMKDGQFEQSAKCYLAMRQITEATNIIAKRHDTPSMKTACQMNLIAQEQEQALIYAHKTLSHYLLAAQWKEAYDFLKEHDGLKVFLPVVIAHELLIEQLSLLCPDLALTQKPVTPDSASAAEDQEGKSTKQTLPEFILDKSDIDPVVPWEPLVLCGDGIARRDDGAGEGLGPLHTFPHHLMRVWHKRLNIAMITTDLKGTRVAIDHLTKMRSSMIDPPNVLVTVSIHVTSCLLALLASDTSSAINHLLKAMAVIQSGSNVNDQYKLLLPALCRLMLSQGPKYLLKLQQEFKALHVLLTMESDGNLDRAGGEGNNSIKRFLTDIKGEETISTSSNWCRELDCVRAYYYLAVLDFMHETQRAEEMARFPNVATTVGGCASSTQENDSLDGEPTSEGSSSGVPSTGSGKRPASISVSSEQEEHLGGEKSASSDPTCSEDLDQNGRLVTSATVVSDKSCDDAVKKSESASTMGESGSKSPVTSESSKPIFPLSATKNPEGGAGPSLESSVDPPPVPVSGGVAQSKDHQKQSNPISDPSTLSPTSHPSPSTSLSPTGKQSPKKSPGVMSSKSISPHHTSMSPRSEALSSSRQASPSRHITSIASSPQTPGSRSSTASTPGHCRRGELTKDNLLRLSRGLLWDTQAKSEVLTETLGYIHKAIAHHLLNHRDLPTPTSNTAVTVPTAAAATSHGAGHSSEAVASTISTPMQSQGSAHQVGSTTSAKAEKTSPLSASGQPQSDSLEEDGSVQQRRMTTLSTSPQQLTQSSSGVGAKEGSPSQRESTQKEFSPASPSSKSLSPQSSKPSHVSPSTSPVSASSVQAAAVTKQDTTPRSATRSLSESSANSPSGATAAKPGFDRTIGIQAERDLLGELAGEPISFSNSKKVLWLDNSTKPNWQVKDPVPLMLSPNGKSLRTAPEVWAAARNQALLGPDGSRLPVEWDELPIDEKFDQSYVTMALLKHQQEAVWQELKKGPDISKAMFPPRSYSVQRLLECCIDSFHLSHEEKKVYIKQLLDWAMLFSVTTYQKAETEALFKNIPEEFRD